MAANVRDRRPLRGERRRRCDNDVRCGGRTGGHRRTGGGYRRYGRRRVPAAVAVGGLSAPRGE